MSGGGPNPVAEIEEVIGAFVCDLLHGFGQILESGRMFGLLKVELRTCGSKERGTTLGEDIHRHQKTVDILEDVFQGGAIVGDDRIFFAFESVGEEFEMAVFFLEILQQGVDGIDHGRFSRSGFRWGRGWF